MVDRPTDDHALLTAVSGAGVREVSLVPFDANRHLAKLEHWLRSPQVERWWGDPEAAIRQALERPRGAGHALIAAAGETVGYLRWQRPARAELDAAGLTDIPAGAVDIDILIGEPAWRGRSVGPRALRLLLARLARDPEVTVAGMSTSTANHAAVRAYEKAGFRRLRRYHDPEYGECWVMTREP